MVASTLLLSCPVFRVNRVFLTFLAAKSLYLYYYLKKKLLADQFMWCREENFIVFMHVLRSIVDHAVDYEIPEIKTMHTFTSLSFLVWLCMWL